jgi:hypothetical protein
VLVGLLRVLVQASVHLLNPVEGFVVRHACEWPAVPIA